MTIQQKLEIEPQIQFGIRPSNNLICKTIMVLSINKKLELFADMV